MFFFQRTWPHTACESSSSCEWSHSILPVQSNLWQLVRCRATARIRSSVDVVRLLAERISRIVRIRGQHTGDCLRCWHGVSSAITQTMNAARGRNVGLSQRGSLATGDSRAATTFSSLRSLSVFLFPFIFIHFSFSLLLLLFETITCRRDARSVPLAARCAGLDGGGSGHRAAVMSLVASALCSLPRDRASTPHTQRHGTTRTHSAALQAAQPRVSRGTRPAHERPCGEGVADAIVRLIGIDTARSRTHALAHLRTKQQSDASKPARRPRSPTKAPCPPPPPPPLLAHLARQIRSTTTNIQPQPWATHHRAPHAQDEPTRCARHSRRRGRSRSRRRTRNHSNSRTTITITITPIMFLPLPLCSSHHTAAQRSKAWR